MHDVEAAPSAIARSVDVRAPEVAPDVAAGATAVLSASRMWCGAAHGLTPDGLLSIQRLAGNRAVQRLVEADRAPVAPMPAVQRWELADISVPSLGDILQQIPGYDMLTLVAGFDPATGEDVDVTPSSLVRAVLGLAPGGRFVHDQLVELEVLQDVYELIDTQLAANDLTAARLEREVDRAWEEVDLTPRLAIVSEAVAVVERRIDAVLADAERFAGSLVDAVLAIVKEAAIAQAERLLAGSESARQIWDLARAVLKYDPLRGEDVESTTEEIIEKFLLLIGREVELERMKAEGTLTATAEWVDTQLEQFTGIIGDFTRLVDDAVEALSFERLPDLPQNLVDLAQRGLALIERIAAFATTVAEKVLELIKEALLGLLNEHAQSIPGFHLMTVLLGRNPLTGEVVLRTAENIIHGFITLLPGGEAQYEQLVETGVIPEAAARIDAAIESLGITWEFVVGLFTELWESFTIDDLLEPEAAFDRIVARFEEPIGRLFAFVRTAAEEIFKLVLGLMNFPSDLVGRIITNALAAFEQIQADPIGFFMNLLGALKLGLGNFFDNIVSHLVDGLASWLLRGLQDAGVEIPDELTLESVLDVVLQVLGITAENLWAKLAERIGPERVEQIRGAVDQLTGIWQFVADVQERGIVAVWEYISDQIGGLWDLLLQKAQDWIMTEIVEAVIGKLLSMLDPTGIMAVVNSFVAFFRAVQSAIDYLRDILEIVDRYVATIADIAAGTVEPAAAQLEGGLASSIPVAIGFMANQVGLGDIAERVREIIGSLRELVDRALDWLLDRAVEAGSAVLGAFGLGGPEEETTADEQGGAAAVEGDQAMAAAVDVADTASQVAGQPGSPAQVRSSAESAGERHLAGAGTITVTNLPPVQRTETVIEEAPQAVPEAEELTPRSATPTEPASAGNILSVIEQRMPALLREFAQSPSSQRDELDDLEQRFRAFMAGKRDRALTAAEHAEGLDILTPARTLSRRYYNSFRDFAWRTLRNDDELAGLIGADDSGAQWGSSGHSSLQIKVEVTRADGSKATQFRPIDFEHITRVTDQPFRRHSGTEGEAGNLTPMLGDLNRYVNEAIRNELGAHMFGADEIEQFVVQHQLYPGGSPARREVGFQPVGGPAVEPPGGWLDWSGLADE